MTFDGRNIDRRRQIIDDGVEHCLNALVLERGAAEHGDDEAADGSAANGVTNLLDREVLTAEILLDQRFVVRDSGLDDIVPRLLHRLAILLGNFRNLELLAQRFVVEDVLLALDDVDMAGEELAGSHR